MAMPHTLVAGTEIEAAPLNENFVFLLSKIETLEARKNYKPGTPGAQVERAVNSEFEPSSTVDTLVYLTAAGASGVGIVMVVKVGGVQVAEPAASTAAGSSNVVWSGIVPAGKKWQVPTAGSSGIVVLKSSYQTLE
jgi:hypothetical protein